jgi:hypothetical protein
VSPNAPGFTVPLADHYFEPTQFHEIHQRGANTCRHCNRVPEIHPPSPHIPRDIEDEERIQNYAVALAPKINASPILHMAHARAFDGPVTDADSRNNGQEIREELSDACNYVTWQIQKLDRADAGEAEKMAWSYVLIKLAEAWDAVTAAEHPEG